ncbi:MAG: helix-turn-helix domain-containing protein, partial [Chitinophagaceae bacterium]|nr:helix-turn-helix domain-containing protein [Chitinophagaceae bacterium]
MLARLQHPLCVLNITDELTRECHDLEYRKDLLSVLILKDNHGSVLVNGADVYVEGHALCFLTHYQPVVFSGMPLGGASVIQFNADVFCIQQHDSEIGCNGTLFNSIYEPPILNVTTDQLSIFNAIVQQMLYELSANKAGRLDMLECYIKQILVHAVRIKRSRPACSIRADAGNDVTRMSEFRQLVGEHYRNERKLKFYADNLHVSESYLYKLVKRSTGRNFTELLGDRLLLDAKSQLFVTNDTVKEISYELGFNDPAYFNRFFKKQC